MIVSLMWAAVLLMLGSIDPHAFISSIVSLSGLAVLLLNGSLFFDAVLRFTGSFEVYAMFPCCDSIMWFAVVDQNDSLFRHVIFTVFWFSRLQCCNSPGLDLSSEAAVLTLNGSLRPLCCSQLVWFALPTCCF